MELWRNRAIDKRMYHLARKCARKPGSAAEKNAVIALWNAPLKATDPIQPPCRTECCYTSKIITPQRVKDDTDYRMHGTNVTNGVLEISTDTEIICAITFQRLDNAYDISHTLGFKASRSLVRDGNTPTMALT